ncbi:HAD family hydrolase [Catenuloplanes japonicus]|uniref:hypothetical protein n=1 Tax=Catenuloplanes japonicus TaxID=33876 RepID=UPI0005259F8F|nr:hypothetical protein [Catenuloplanes japonicus]
MTAVVLTSLDETLIAGQDATLTAITRTLHDEGITAGPDAADIVLETAQDCWSRYVFRHESALTGVTFWDALWLTGTGLPDPVADTLITHSILVWNLALARLGGDPSRASYAAAGFRRYRALLGMPLPGTARVLASWRRAHEVWLVTTGLPTHERVKIGLAGLTTQVDRIVTCQQGTDLRALLAGRQVCLAVSHSAQDSLRMAAYGGWPVVHPCPRTPCPARDRDGDVLHTGSTTTDVTCCSPADPGHGAET